MSKKMKFLAFALITALSACGGGGGSPGETQENYSITLRADKTLLPINVDGIGPGIGAYRPFTTSLYVEARKGSLPIPGGEEIFGCNVSGGLDSGSLYYLDGDSEHETEVDDGNGGTVKVPNAYRNITLGSNSGGNSFHFHAGDQAGTARITCSVTDPRDNRVYSASVNIVVGQATQKPASVVGIPQGLRYVGSRDNLNNIKNSVVIQAFVMDDANQPVPNPSASNIQVSIRSSLGAAAGSRLISNNQSGSVLQLTTIGGVAQFSLSSGPAAGPIVLEFTTDRADNNISNGIQDAISSLRQVDVVNAVASVPLTVSQSSFGTVTNGIPFTFALVAQGGVPPYKWAISGLPAGLVGDSSGVISGTPSAPKGTYGVTVVVTDANGDQAAVNMTLLLEGEHLPINPDDFTINGCGGDLNAVCALPGATAGDSYVYAFSASVSGVTWEFSGLPTWLRSGTAGSNGFVNGTPIRPDLSDPAAPDLGSCGTHRFLVTAKRGVMSVTRQVSITVTGGIAPNVCP